MTIHLCHQGRQIDAFSREQVEAMLKAGVIADGTLAWTSGMAEWKALRDVLGSGKPPPVPGEQAATSSTSGLTSRRSAPSDDPPKTELPSSLSVPPVISAPPFADALSEPVRQEILKLARVGFGRFIIWTLFILGLASASIHGGSQPNPVASLLAFVFGIIVFRSWCERRTMRTILKRGSFRRIYLPAVWSFEWRSSCTGIGVAFLLGFAQDMPVEKVGTFTFALLLWLILSLFALDVPFWCRKRVDRIIGTIRAETMSPARTSVLHPLAAVIVAVLCVGAAGVSCWLSTKPAGGASRIGKLITEHQHYNQELANLVESGADLEQKSQLQNSHYTNLSRMAASAFVGDGKKVYEVMKPITDQAVALRQKCQEDMRKLLAAGFVDPATMTNAAAVAARKDLAATFSKDTAEAYAFFGEHVEKLNASLAAAGVDKPTRDRILAKNRALQPKLLDLAHNNTGIAKYVLAITTFLGDNYGHWRTEDGVCIFETQEKANEYNRFNKELRSYLEEEDRLERSFFEKR